MLYRAPQAVVDARLIPWAAATHGRGPTATPRKSSRGAGQSVALFGGLVQQGFPGAVRLLLRALAVRQGG
jgi:hypothetical protein